MNPQVDFFFTKAKQWKPEYEKLRIILNDSGLKEMLKWGVPCYQWNEKNIVLIHGFKTYCAILFHKGVLLNDPKKILIQQTKNVQSARQIRFTRLDEITALEPTIRAYIKEAIELEKSGAKVSFKTSEEFEMPDEFTDALKKNKALKKAFDALTPGRKKGYLLYFSQAKQPQTRLTRIDKCTPDILNGKGLND